jgi:hypothetical protein
MCAIMRLFFRNQEIVAVALWATRTLRIAKRLQCLHHKTSNEFLVESCFLRLAQQCLYGFAS